MLHKIDAGTCKLQGRSTESAGRRRPQALPHCRPQAAAAPGHWRPLLPQPAPAHITTSCSASCMLPNMQAMVVGL